MNPDTLQQLLGLGLMLGSALSSHALHRALRRAQDRDTETHLIRAILKQEPEQ